MFIHGALDNRELAQPLIDARLKVRPWENQKYYRDILTYYRHAQDIDQIVESASKAGIPPE